MKRTMMASVSAWPVLFGIAAALAGCQTTEPVREYSSVETIAPAERESLEPVGEFSTVVRTDDYHARPIGRVYDSTTGNFERRAPYGPNTPTSPSQWW